MNLQAIAKAYVRRIERNEITIEDVPEQIKIQVLDILNEQKEEE